MKYGISKIKRILTGILGFLILSLPLFSQTVPGMEIENTAAAEYRDAGGFLYSVQSPTVITTVSPGSALTISKHADKTVFLPLDTVEYHIRLENSGNSAASSVTILDSLPAGLVYIASEPVANLNDNVLLWNLLNIQAGATAEIVLTVSVAPAVPSGTVLENTAHYRTPDDASGSSMPFAISIGSLPDLYLEKRVDRAEAEAGDTLNYTVILENTGNLATTNTMLYDDIPDGTELLSSSGNPEYQSGILRWNIGLLEAAERFEAQIRLIIGSGAVPGTSIRNSVSVGNSEGIKRNAAAVTTITESIGEPELWIRKSAVENAAPGDTVTYRIAYGNKGSAKASEPLLIDSMDARLVFLDAEGDYHFDAEANKLSWYPDDLQAGTSDSLLLRAVIALGVEDAAIIRNTAALRCSESVGAETLHTLSIIAPQLTLDKTVSQDEAEAGTELKYTLSYLNNGNGSAGNVMIRDTLSADVEYVSGGEIAAYDSLNHVVSWNIGSLPANMNSAGTRELLVRVKAPLPNGKIINNKATLSCDEGFSVNASETFTVISTPVLTLTKSGPENAFPGDTVLYRISYGNEGNTSATQTVISDTLPNKLEFLSADGVYAYDPLQHVLSWNIGEVTAGTDSVLLLKTRVLTDLTGMHQISNTAYISSQEVALASNSVLTSLSALILEIAADPDSILANGENYAEIMASLTDASGQPFEDGTPVIFTASAGEFASGTDTVLTLNGLAQTRLYSEKTNREFLTVKVKAEALYHDAKAASDSLELIFYSKTLVGYVSDDEDEPVSGAVVTLMQDDETIGSDTTASDGYYSIPIFVSGSYTIIISYVDRFGITRTVEYDVEIVVDDTGETQIVQEKCAISGNIVDQITQLSIHEAGIRVIIGNDTTASMAKAAESGFRDTTFTDSTGFWSFNSLDPGRYIIETTYSGSGYYHAGSRLINLDAPGSYVINADIILQPVMLRTFKTVDKPVAMAEDTLKYSIYYETLEYPVSDTIRISDKLPEALEWIPASLNLSDALQLEAYDGIANELHFRRTGMPAASEDSIVFTARIRNNISGTAKIVNSADLFYGNDTVTTAADTRSNAETQIVSPFLIVQKNVNRRVAESGDILTYTVSLVNRSDEHTLSALQIYDILPPGFRYREKRSYIDGKALADPLIAFTGKRQTLTWFPADTLAPGGKLELRYRVYVGLESPYGENENIASAEATLQSGFRIASANASAAVIIKPGIIHERGFIFGKVFYDSNGNNVHDSNEKTLQGVEIVTEEGIRVLTDEYGKYSIPNISSGNHVLRINRKSLPENSKLRLFSSDFLGDPLSRLVKVSPSGIAKANFILDDVSADAETGGAGDKAATVREAKIPQGEKQSSGAPETGSALLKFSMQSLTESFRLSSYQPWTLNLYLEFSPGGSVPKPKDECDMDQIVDFLKWQNHLQLLIKGHTDNTPIRHSPFADNKALSLARAETVKNYMQSQGISPERIKVKACGDSEPLMSNATAAGRSANRRIELVFCMDETQRMYEKGLRFRLEISYEGSQPLQKLQLKIHLPEGFSASEYTEDPDSLIMDLNTEKKTLQHNFEFCSTPSEPHNIHAFSTLSAYLEYSGSDGIAKRSGNLQLRIPTQVDKSLFSIVLEGAKFHTGSANLPYDVLPEIKKLGEFLQWREEMHVRIEGFTDIIGTESDNLRLSQARADAVKRYLIKYFGIDAGRIKTFGYGEKYPSADNGSPEGRAKNRRVEIIIESDFIQAVESNGLKLEDSLQLEIRFPAEKSMINKRKNKP